MAAEAASSSPCPSALNVVAVVREPEGTMVPPKCFEVATRRCAIARVCKLRGVLEEAMQALYGVLEQYTLQHLVRDRAPLARLLFLPPSPAPGAGRSRSRRGRGQSGNARWTTRC